MIRKARRIRIHHHRRAGDGTCGYSGDGGPATDAEINPTNTIQGGQVALDAAGNLYFGDLGSSGRSSTPAQTPSVIRRIDTSGTISTYFNSSPCLQGYWFISGPTYDTPEDLTVTPDGSVYVACYHQVLRIAADGSTQAFKPVDGGTVVHAVASDASGTVYVSEYLTPVGHEVVGTLGANGTVTTVVDVTAVTGDRSIAMTHLAFDAQGTLYGAAGPWDTLGDHYSSPSFLRVGNSGLDLPDRFRERPRRSPGTGNPDPGASAQSGYGYQLDLSPLGMAVDSGGNLPCHPPATSSTGSPTSPTRAFGTAPPATRTESTPAPTSPAPTCTV